MNTEIHGDRKVTNQDKRWGQTYLTSQSGWANSYLKSQHLRNLCNKTCCSSPSSITYKMCKLTSPRGTRTPKQWEISHPEQSHRQDRIAGQLFSNILCFYSIFPLWRALLNVNQNHMAGKSQLCEPQEPPQKHHHLCCILCSTIRFLSIAWSYVDSKPCLQKELAGGRIQVHYTMVMSRCFWFPERFVATIQIQRWILSLIRLFQKLERT